MRLMITDVFDDDESRRKGLMGRMIGGHECVLFLYPVGGMHSFWMKDVPVDLYASAIDGGKCVWSEHMEAFTVTPHVIGAMSRVIIESCVEIPVGSDVDILNGFLEFA